MKTVLLPRAVTFCHMSCAFVKRMFFSKCSQVTSGEILLLYFTFALTEFFLVNKQTDSCKQRDACFLISQANDLVFLRTKKYP